MTKSTLGRKGFVSAHNSQVSQSIATESEGRYSRPELGGRYGNSGCGEVLLTSLLLISSARFLVQLTTTLLRGTPPTVGSASLHQS